MRTKIVYGKKYIINYDGNIFIGKLVGNDDINLIVEIDKFISGYISGWNYKHLEEFNCIVKYDESKKFLFIDDHDIIKRAISYYPNTELYRKLYPKCIVKNNLLEVEL